MEAESAEEAEMKSYAEAKKPFAHWDRVDIGVTRVIDVLKVQGE